MTHPVAKGPEFERDVAAHFAWYLTEANEDVAWRFKRAVDSALVTLSQQPAVGRRCKFRAAALRELRSFRVDPPFERILIFYRVVGDAVEAWRAMHGARDLPQRLVEPPGAS